ncbi:putative AAA+ ATPase domain-containing protein [Seiridium unicorne]|uniref:AAA+ ATPase domain-containing protein n=1 Tax=Seiridium unicorne TaxID=138068 RepID=A0ABR2UWY9_9PEZI
MMAENAAAKIHPFFSAPKSVAPNIASTTDATRPVTPDPSCSPASDEAHENIQVAADDETELAQGRRKRRKTDSAAEVQQPAKRGRPKGKAKPRVSTGSNITNHFGPKGDGASGSAVHTNESHDAGPEVVKTEPEQSAEQSQQVQTPPPTVIPEQPPTQNDEEQTQESKPRKILRFNPKTGTIGSPPRTKAQPPDEVVLNHKPAVKSRKPKKATSLVVRINYDFDEGVRVRIGEKIEEIFSGVRYISPKNNEHTSAQSTTQQTTPPTSSQGTPKKQASKKGHTLMKAKPAHPFFTAKSKATSTAADAVEGPKSPVKRQSIFTSTPCSPKHARQQASKFNFPQFGNKAGGLKFPGARHAAWPWRGIVHLHGDERDVDSATQIESCWEKHASRKAKGREVEFPADESVLGHVERQLHLDELAEELKTLNTEDFLPTPPTLRTPERHFESGHRLQARIKQELCTYTGDKRKTHPAIFAGFHTLTTTLPAFDRSTCESTSWAQKYGPIKANQVLQNGKEAELLRDWLQTLKVQSVDTGASDGNAANPKSAPVKKKKRKKLDGFVISSDEEQALMDEISDDESAWLPNSVHGSSKRTVVRSGSSKDVKLTNTVLLSGPHGCGKTATVYAIAKELDFEVFEISPGSRRNGKDIIEKIGDMTRNHQVSHKQETPQPDDTINADDVARDISSGKQGMMTAFFKPNAVGVPKLAKKQPIKKLEKTLHDKPIKRSNRAQKQSLILLEEVDILYEEDKQFWATVISLMAQSKRPFIMTCNNENLVPVQSLSLHGIFRFGAAPKDLAVDHLLLIAANEGHALSRPAVEALYESRSCDLRASIAELQYWCQIGVGDSKGGLGWFYRTWPKGSDLDEHGDRIRVVSSGTYQAGMGWLGRDPLSNSFNSSSIEGEIIRQAWDNWALDTEDCEVSAKALEEVEAASAAQLGHKDRLALLDIADSFYDSLSVADLASQGFFSNRNQALLDPSLPGLPSKVKDDFIIGLQLLDAPTLCRYETTTFDLATSIRSLARAQVAETHIAPLVDHHPLDEMAAIQKIQTSFNKPPAFQPAVTRYDYSLAFDPIAISEKALAQSSGYLDPSVFDRTMRMITLDVAPYVRSIVAYDQRLQAERLLRSNLLSEGGKPKKRMRSTRAAYSALEGGSRASTRREKYFCAGLNPHLVMQTGGKGWETLANDEHVGTGNQGSYQSSIASSDDMDTSTG